MNYYESIQKRMDTHRAFLWENDRAARMAWEERLILWERDRDEILRQCEEIGLVVGVVTSLPPVYPAEIKPFCLWTKIEIENHQINLRVSGSSQFDLPTVAYAASGLGVSGYWITVQRSGRRTKEWIGLTSMNAKSLHHGIVTLMYRALTDTSASDSAPGHLQEFVPLGDAPAPSAAANITEAGFLAQHYARCQELQTMLERLMAELRSKPLIH
jgi:hypothetical protein